jgi:hypothetical protein
VKQALLFLKKKKQKNFSPLGARVDPTRVPKTASLRVLAKQSSPFLAFPSSPQTRSRSSNCRASPQTEAQTDKSFLVLFFKKEQLPC